MWNPNLKGFEVGHIRELFRADRGMRVLFQSIGVFLSQVIHTFYHSVHSVNHGILDIF